MRVDTVWIYLQQQQQPQEHDFAMAWMRLVLKKPRNTNIDYTNYAYQW